MKAFVSVLLCLIAGMMILLTGGCVKQLGEPLSLWNDANEHMKSFAVFQTSDPEFARTQYATAFQIVETLLSKHPDSPIVLQLNAKQRKIHLWTLEEFLFMEKKWLKSLDK
jgi:hypothetical protein